MNAPAKPLLDYAPANPSRKWVWRSCCLLLLAVVGFIGWNQVWPMIRNRAQLLSLQQQCLNSIKSPNAMILDVADVDISGGQCFADTAPCWHALAATPDGGMSNAFRQFFPNVFLHGRTTPAGKTYLVGVTIHDAASAHRVPVHELVVMTSPPVGMLQTQSPVTTISSALNFGPDRIQHLYAGQPDPNDPSHFTIRVDLFGGSETIDGYLDNQGQVTLTRRRAPSNP